MKPFTINRFGGINQVDPLDTLKEYEATNLRNVRIGQTCKIRQGTQLVGNIGTGIVRALKEVDNTLFAVQGANVKKLVNGAWVATGLSGINATNIPKFIRFPTSSEVNSASGTVSSMIENGMGIIDNSASFAENIHVDKFIKITTGAGAGQVRLITANTDKEIFVNEAFKDTPNGNFVIQNKVEGTYFFNGVDQPKKQLDTNSVIWTNINNVPYFKLICEYNNRLIGVLPDSDILHISALFTGEDYPYEIATKNKYPITSIKAIGNQLVINKGMKGGIFIAEFDDISQAVLIQRADNFGGINDESVDVGENMFFFASERGIELFNTLETNMLEGHKAISDYRLNELKGIDMSNAQGICFDAKYWCAVNNKVYIFDIAQYLQYYEEGKPRPYTFLIDEGYEAKCLAVLNGELYIGGTNKVVKLTGTTDEGIAINAYWSKSGIDLGETFRNKCLRQINVVSANGSLANILAITVSTEKEAKLLDNITLERSVKRINGKRTTGKTFSFTFNLSGIGGAEVHKIEGVMERGR